MVWRVARSLLALRDQLDAAYPARSRASDGTIGDTAHQSQGSDSDHNPWYGPGIVTAFDVTHDPAHGLDIDRLSDQLQASRDARIKYVIANGLIMSGSAGPSPWVWRPYGGSDPHRNHLHLSVVASPACDDVRAWNLGGTPVSQPQPLGYSQNSGLASVVRAIVEGATEDGFIDKTGVKWDDAAAKYNLKMLSDKIDGLAAKTGQPAPVALSDADRAGIAGLVAAQLQTKLAPLIDLAARIGNG